MQRNKRKDKSTPLGIITGAFVPKGRPGACNADIDPKLGCGCCIANVNMSTKAFSSHFSSCHSAWHMTVDSMAIKHGHGMAFMFQITQRMQSQNLIDTAMLLDRMLTTDACLSFGLSQNGNAACFCTVGTIGKLQHSLLSAACSNSRATARLHGI